MGIPLVAECKYVIPSCLQTLASKLSKRSLKLQLLFFDAAWMQVLVRGLLSCESIIQVWCLAVKFTLASCKLMGANNAKPKMQNDRFFFFICIFLNVSFSFFFPLSVLYNGKIWFLITEINSFWCTQMHF